ncbi:hypothetical protein DM02DRAFT_598400 [Periconia macrospinosa]|uniref:Uncharacterized protein n=1 Tax=Periconia macrospinosa TaxID=97972 RepID=A0A2V1DH45_9PLEO|nr:hypothetical protein DM02DRAFT_598400 [Periconia macrospinosa]
MTATKDTTAAGGQSFKDRTCPNMRSCWTISYHSYSLRTSDTRTKIRRACMIWILLCRLVISILSIVAHIWGGFLVSVIVGSILTVLGFFFIAWALAVIGDAEGRRKVFGVMIGRWHLDIFLYVVAALHVAMFIGFFFDFRVGLGGTWLAMWLIIWGVAWVCTWPADEAESQV